MLATLRKLLVASLLMVLLAATPGYAAALDEAKALVRQANALAMENRRLEAHIGDQLEQVFAIDPAGKHAADAMPMLRNAQFANENIGSNTQSIIALWDQVISLGTSEEDTTYALQQKKIWETNLQFIVAGGELIAMYRTLYDRNELAKLSKAEVKAFDKELIRLEARNGALFDQVNQMSAASQRYYDEHEVGQPGGTTLTWVAWISSMVVSSTSALVCGLVARKKNRNVIGWGIFGFLIPIAALIAIFVVRRVDLRPQSTALLQPRL